MSRPARRAQRGMNLVELVIAIVIISIAAAGVLLVYAETVRHSADPMIKQQALAVAEGYLDEILVRPVADPDGTSAGEARSTFDDVLDYAGLAESPPRTQDGSVLDLDADGQPDLAGYSVSVTVDPGADLGGVTLARVDVRVQFPPVVDFVLTGYRYGND